MANVTTPEPQAKKYQLNIVQWMDKHVLPLLAVVALLGFAVRGIMQYLPIINHEAQLVVGILAVAFLGFKAFAK